jgi:hypothetical protein
MCRGVQLQDLSPVIDEVDGMNKFYDQGTDEFVGHSMCIATLALKMRRSAKSYTVFRRPAPNKLVVMSRLTL